MAFSHKIRFRTHQLLDGGHSDDRMSRAVNIFIIVLVILNIIAVILESEPYLKNNWGNFFYWFEFVSVIIFSIEYLARVWTIVDNAQYKKPIIGRLKFCFSPLAIMDLLAILPFYLGAVFVDLRFLRMLRLLRLMRIAKLVRYLPALQIFINALRRRYGELSIAFALMCLLLIFSSSLMYFAERKAQPEQFSSIPSTMWWAVATLGKVSYGDIKPITVHGKVLAGFISILGIAVFALPAGILGSAFIEEVQEKKRSKHSNIQTCPHCNKSLDTPTVDK